MRVVSLRLKDAEPKKLEALSRMEHKEKSAVLREFTNYAWEPNSGGTACRIVNSTKNFFVSQGFLAEKLWPHPGVNLTLKSSSGSLPFPPVI